MSMRPDPLPLALHDVPRETIDKFDTYAALLVRWQQHMNLVGASTLSDLWVRHVADSAQLMPFLPDRNAVILDVGSGAGFPGLVLSILGYTNVHLVESDQRKCVFLREVARAVGVSPTIHATRVESLILPRVDVVTSRACGNLSKLFHILWHLMGENAICLFHKGKNYTKEVEEAKGWVFNLNAHPSQTPGDGVILEITHIRQEVER